MDLFFYCGPEHDVFDPSLIGADILLFKHVVQAIRVCVRDRDACVLIAEYLCGPTEFRRLFNSPILLQHYHAVTGHLIPRLVDSTLVNMLLRCNGSVTYGVLCLDKLLFVRGMQDDEDTSSKDIFEAYFKSTPGLESHGPCMYYANMYQGYGERLERELRFSRNVAESLEAFYKYATDDYHDLLFTAGYVYGTSPHDQD